MKYLDALTRRYSVKKFNPELKVSEEILHRILEAARLSASSLGLQPYRIIIAESDAVKTQLIPAFYNPSQISTCSHLIAIVSKNSIGNDYISSFFEHISETRNVPVENLNPFRNSISSHMERMRPEEIMVWSDKQSYIVLGNLMFAAALESVDTCPMEGFNPEIIGEILNIDPQTERVAVTLALGYRSGEDHFQNLKKVRKPTDKLFKFI